MIGDELNEIDENRFVSPERSGGVRRFVSGNDWVRSEVFDAREKLIAKARKGSRKAVLALMAPPHNITVLVLDGEKIV